MVIYGNSSQHTEFLKTVIYDNNPDSKVHRANMGPIWGGQDPGGPHVGPMNFAIWEVIGIYSVTYMFISDLQVSVCVFRWGMYS